MFYCFILIIVIYDFVTAHFYYSPYVDLGVDRKLVHTNFMAKKSVTFSPFS